MTANSRKTTSPRHEAPNAGEPVRAAKASGFDDTTALSTPADQRRPARDSQTPQTHPLNRPIADEDKSLIGPKLGKGGIGQVTQAHATPDPPPHEVYEGCHDVTGLIMRPREGASASDGDGDE
jgi:hypothetical protein